MRDIVFYTVVSKLPERLAVLEEMARNLWFSWNLEAVDLFRSVDQNLWDETSLEKVVRGEKVGTTITE